MRAAVMRDSKLVVAEVPNPEPGAGASMHGEGADASPWDSRLPAIALASAPVLNARNLRRFSSVCLRGLFNVHVPASVTKET